MVRRLVDLLSQVDVRHRLESLAMTQRSAGDEDDDGLLNLLWDEELGTFPALQLLSLAYDHNDQYEVDSPDRSMDTPKLRRLELDNVRLFTSLKGRRSLRSLHISRLSICAREWHDVCHECPLLETVQLQMISCTGGPFHAGAGTTTLRLLRHLSLGGHMEATSMVLHSIQAPQLRTLRMWVAGLPDHYEAFIATFTTFIVASPNVRKLYLDGHHESVLPVLNTISTIGAVPKLRELILSFPVESGYFSPADTSQPIRDFLIHRTLPTGRGGENAQIERLVVDDVVLAYDYKWYEARIRDLAGLSYGEFNSRFERDEGFC